MTGQPPLELVVLDFPESEVPRPLEAEMHRLTFLGDLRVLEAFAVAKDRDGNRVVLDVARALSNGEITHPLPEPTVLVPTEVEAIGDALAPGRTALAMVIEHAWIHNLREVFRSVRGTVLLSVVLDRGDSAEAGPADPAEIPRLSTR